MSQILGLFAKWPVPGRVKTRLASDTSPEFAARLADAFLRDSLARLSNIEARRILAGTPTEHAVEFGALASPLWEYRDQGDSDLGQRMRRFFSASFDGGAMKVVVVGTDSPTVPIEYVAESFELLAAHDLVLGPAVDGGYYLIGGTTKIPEVFSGISWGTADVLRQTIDRAGDARMAVLPPWYDVDTLADCRFLATHIKAMRRSGDDPRVSATIAVIETLPT